MGKGSGSCNSKSDDAVADDEGRPVRPPQPSSALPGAAMAPSPTPTTVVPLPTGSQHPVTVSVDPAVASSSIASPAPMLSPSQVVLSSPSSSSPLAAYLSKVPLLSKLSPAERAQLAAALTEQTFPASTAIVREGEEGSSFYLIKDGQARVTKAGADGHDVELAVLNPSDYFGEQALVNNSRRMATITALTPLTLLCMTREQFAALFGSDRLGISFVKRAAVSAESYTERKEDGDGGSARLGQSTHEAQAVKTEAQREVLLGVVRQNLLFAQLTEQQRALVVDRMWLQPVQASSTIIKQGDLGDFFYVVERGVFDIFVRAKAPLLSPTSHPPASPPPTDPSSPHPVKVAERRAAESFGELALLYNAPRAATVIAREDSAVWVLSRWTFRKIVTSGNAAKLKEYEAFLRRVTSFEALLDYERAKIAEALEEVSYSAGAVIVRQGDDGDTFFLVRTGEVRCTIRDADGGSVEVARYTAGNYFGERALVKNEKRAATVTAVNAVTCLYLNRDAFALLLGPFEDIFNRRVQGYSTPASKPAVPSPDKATVPPVTVTPSPAPAPGAGASAAVSPSLPKSAETPGSSKPAVPSLHLTASTATGSTSASASSVSPAPAPRYSLSEFKIVGTLGKGSFGHVQLVRHYLTNTTYALKTVNKMSVVRLGQQEHMVNERRAMMALQHPFLIRLYSTFQDRNFIYMLLEVSLGGELFSVLRSRTLFDEATAKFYAAGVVVAFGYMHERGYIYRDLKPENLLLDSKGYLKITDFGFAKNVGDGRTWTLCGTPDYLAPEVVSGQGHGKGVDWWTLGILMYEMLASYPPFYDEDPMRTYAKIMRGELHFPSHFSRASIDLIRRLLHPKPTKRLGVVVGGVKLIRDHPWFMGFDWAKFERMELRAPILMKIANLEDLSNFEVYPDDGKKPEAYAGDPKHPDWDKEF